MTIWTILGLISAVMLVITFFKANNAVWGGLTISIVLGFILGLIYMLLGKGFDWSFIYKAAIIGIIIGFLSELLGIIGDKTKK
jgi:hypothetical protein